ncbi:hypothetical protein N7456_008115 [Penicillium angulare]|uniref:Beta-lactamase-related domain-containing protein n=1 Tax=Penicillium angulare TaxID=116970 RepID=A0A9W9K8S7_9EURO|nr:hypothetical protein N7456_008115 [Penicillium angulare]
MADTLTTDAHKDVVSRLEAAMSDVENVMKMAEVPSISLGIIHEGNVIFRRSFGLRDIEKNLEANSDTSYLIGSCSKMITCTALGLLVEEGKLMWGDKIRTHLPDFNPIEDPQIGENATLIDAARHSTGLANPVVISLGPDGILSNTANDHLAMVNALPTSCTWGQRFRRCFYYSNAVFGLIPQVIEVTSNTRFADFVQQRILEPLGLQQTLLHEASVQNNDNLAYPYAPQSNNSWVKIKNHTTTENHSPILGALGMRSSVNDLLSFLAAVMNRYDEERGAEPQQPLSSSATHNPLRKIVRMWDSWWNLPTDDGFPNETAYLLGWFKTILPTAALGWGSLNNYGGTQESIIGRDSEPHTLYGNIGHVNGSDAAAYIFPETHTGIVALSNASDGHNAAEAAARILTQAVFDLKPHVDVPSQLQEAGKRRFQTRRNKVLEWESHRDVTAYTSHSEDFLGNYIGLNTSRVNIIKSDTAAAQVAVQFADETAGVCDLEPYKADPLSFLPIDNDTFLSRGMLDWDYYAVGVFEFLRDSDGQVVGFWWQWERTDWPGLWVKQKDGMSEQDTQEIISKFGRFRKTEN